MSEILLLRSTEVKAAKVAQRVIAGRLQPLRESAKRCDNFDHSTGRLRPQEPTDFTSVEALVMEVSDLAQAYGYFAAVIEAGS